MRVSIVALILSTAAFAQSGGGNLGFEQGQTGEVPPGWFVPPTLKSAGYSAFLTTDGCVTGQCVVITVPEVQPERMFGNLMASIDATPYRGKRVIFRASVRAEKGHAMLWVRVDRTPGVMGFFDNMQDRPIQVGDWKTYEIRGEVDTDATRLNYGVMAHGTNARVLVDEAALEFREINEEPASPSVREALVSQYAVIDRAYSTKKFGLLKEVATPDAVIGSSMMKMPITDALPKMESDLGGAQELSYSTTIDSVQLRDGEAHVRATSQMKLAKDGASTSYVVSNSDIWVLVNGSWRLKQAISTSMRTIQPPLSPEAVRKVASEIRKHAVPLTGVEAGKPYDDLAAFGKAVGDARVVALGEATHGTREIFQMKHRLLEYLVKEKGFTVFAIEANWPESEAADRYVKTGEGDPKAALKDMYFWTWQTQEVLAMLEWMREFNKAPGKHPILTFTSFDMQTWDVARTRVVEYVKQHAPEKLARVDELYAPLTKLNGRMMSNPAFEHAANSAEGVLKLLEAERDALVKASSADAHRNAVQTARIVVQAARMRKPAAGSSYRDQMMATNTEWLLKDAYPGQKIVVWAHNGHITTAEQPGFRPMGNWLRVSLGSELYVLGFGIHKGTVRAVTREGGRAVGLAESQLPAAEPGTGTATLSAAGVPLFFLDLRRSAEGELGQWLSKPQLFRSCGAMWDRDSPESFMRSEALSKSYDGLIYMEVTEAARGL